MGLFDKVSGFVKREAEDIGEVADRARDRLDKELAEREAELEMTPSEKLRALQRQARQNSDRVDEIMEKAGAAEAAAQAEAEVHEAADLEPPLVTQIVLADGSVHTGDEVDSEIEPIEDDESPDQGDLAWVAPRDGEEAIVPAFSSAVSVAAPSSPTQPDTGQPDAIEVAAPVEPEPVALADAVPPSPAPVDETPAPPVEAPPLETAPVAEAAPEVAAGPETVETPQAPIEDAAPPPPPPPPPPVPRREPVAPTPAPVVTEPPRRETPAEIAARVVAELEQAVNDDPAPVRDPIPPPPQPEPTFEKTPAQRKYEEARKAADALLEELRGELKDDGEI